MFIPEANLELLTTILVLVGPFRIVFPVRKVNFACLLLIVRGGELYFMISLSLMMRLISLIMRELTHTNGFITCKPASTLPLLQGTSRTFFPNQGVITIIRIISVTSHCAAAIAQDTEIEF